MGWFKSAFKTIVKKVIKPVVDKVVKPVFNKVVDAAGLGKEGWLTKAVQDYIPGGGLVTAGFHAAAGNTDYAEYAAVMGAGSLVSAAMTAAGSLAGPAGAALAGGLGAMTERVIQGGMKGLLADSVKNKIDDLSLGNVASSFAIGAALGKMGAKAPKGVGKPNVFSRLSSKAKGKLSKLKTRAADLVSTRDLVRLKRLSKGDFRPDSPGGMKLLKAQKKVDPVGRLAIYKHALADNHLGKKALAKAAALGAGRELQPVDAFKKSSKSSRRPKLLAAGATGLAVAVGTAAALNPTACGLTPKPVIDQAATDAAVKKAAADAVAKVLADQKAAKQNATDTDPPALKRDSVQPALPLSDDTLAKQRAAENAKLDAKIADAKARAAKASQDADETRDAIEQLQRNEQEERRADAKAASDAQRLADQQAADDAQRRVQQQAWDDQQRVQQQQRDWDAQQRAQQQQRDWDAQQRAHQQAQQQRQAWDALGRMLQQAGQAAQDQDEEPQRQPDSYPGYTPSEPEGHWDDGS